MAAPASDLTITQTQVLHDDVANLENGIAGEAFGFGVPVYVKASDGRVWQCDADVSAEAAGARGISQSAPVAAGQACVYQKGGSCTLGAGAAMTRGLAYGVSRTKGKICLVSELATADYVTQLGVASSASVLAMQIHRSGVVV